MSIASEWDKMLKRAREFPTIPIRREDLRSLVDDALELERLQGSLESLRTKERAKAIADVCAFIQSTAEKNHAFGDSMLGLKLSALAAVIGAMGVP